MSDQTLAPILHQIQHLFKGMGTAVIRVRHYRAVVLLTKLGQSSHLGVVFKRALGLNQGQVVKNDAGSMACSRNSTLRACTPC